ncbi:4Fe-4S dicluster domain-containing protein [Pigmentiphaga litoralis]|uniref:NAD-dependent dihydropyrimidine dehydrogenase PreA subunit n=1 Tax=Pigmentiphaga litoralis TaxID=516702 RepID=A0A7Y9LP81_9BURK|nr:ferredoxin family protein [Pigmentiphaga litoralis]NYE22729.1 NAD-dependent dihydropyrimidine dehydrogenase PreA subunit [Pigmentiphaga litoralis]NYE83656.1 NAD-dependent dihydropyrimidine dehydrogenase PreA subunit [Pigmentiphaga litoralis]
MIEVISSTRCTGCNVCVTACPANVFDPVPGALPLIARQDDCQTCFLCEIYCPVDALFVSPMADGPAAPGEVTEAVVEAGGLFGAYARELGWKRGRSGGADADPTFRIRAFL